MQDIKPVNEMTIYRSSFGSTNRTLFFGFAALVSKSCGCTSMLSSILRSASVSSSIDQTSGLGSRQRCSTGCLDRAADRLRDVLLYVLLRTWLRPRRGGWRGGYEAGDRYPFGLLLNKGLRGRLEPRPSMKRSRSVDGGELVADEK